MSKTQWTPSQLEAITTKYRTNGESCNLLVGAAAGSGKTAVLVERIIRKLIPEDISKAVDIDKLLVVTFTNAAASEMSERISAALTRELESASDNRRKQLIKRQQLLLSASDITTIDAFCMKLVRSNFNLLDIDPGFSIADGAQASLLSDEAMEEIFSERYDAEDQDFINLLCLYASGRSDEGLAKLVRHIHQFISSIPNPISWLYEKVEELKYENGIENSLWFQKGFADCKDEIDFAITTAKKGLKLMYPEMTDTLPLPKAGNSPFNDWKSYYRAFYNDYMFLTSLTDSTPDKCAQLVKDFSFTSLTALKSQPEELKDILKQLRATVKKSVAKISLFLSISTEAATEQSATLLYPAIKSLTQLVEQYDTRFNEKKRKRNILEFSDIEQLTSKLLRENAEVAEEIRSRYDEILMDEYQDTSALQDEIFKNLSNGSNLFMVGDMKQSIYRFRGSDPSIFKEKNDLYINEEDAENRKIILSKNFRSRSEVLDSINTVFKAIMTEKAGELDYDSDQYLYLGNTGYTKVNPSNKSECCLIQIPQKDDDPTAEFSRAQLEARFVASEINRLKSQHFKVRDGDSVRDIENRDVVILTSSHKNEADIYISELNAQGIECFAESLDYFERNEIRLMTALFKIINNPLCDIPLIGILRSPIAAFTDDQLVIIRKAAKGRFYTAMKALVQMKSNGDLADEEQLYIAEKVEDFLTNLNRWRNYARYMPSDKLIWTLYEETDFYAFAGAMHGGEEAQANLRLLFDRAKQYENNGFQGLFNFIKYIEQMETRSADLSSAKLVSAGHNVVRLMTIHKSKGLEFPVVFLAGGAKKLNYQQNETRLLLHRKYGIAADYIDFENSYRTETPAKSIVKSVIIGEQASEEIRKLYVALTRAKEKLYFVAAIPASQDESITGVEKFLSKSEAKIGENGIIPPESVLSATSFADWVVPVAGFSDNWLLRTLDHNMLAPADKSATSSDTITDKDIDIDYILDFEYKYKEISDLPTKLSVSEIKSKTSADIKPMPEFLKEKRPNGTYYGTAMHTVLQNLIPSAGMDTEYVERAIKQMLLDEALTSDEAALINPEKILKFYNSPIGQRIMNAPKVHREQSFELPVPAEYLYPQLENPEKETILLQGIIDCWFEEDGAIVLVDYKTDSYRDISEIHEKYDIQLELYQYALEQITHKKVKEKYIYLFFDNSVI